MAKVIYFLVFIFAMEAYRACYICGKRAKHVCRLCGRYVCDEHYVPELGVCTNCARGKRFWFGAKKLATKNKKA